MAQTNANAAYAARTLSLAAKFMGTAPVFDVRPVDPLKNTKLNWKIPTMEPALKGRAAVHPR
jgi:hypothetical protein